MWWWQRKRSMQLPDSHSHFCPSPPPRSPSLPSISLLFFLCRLSLWMWLFGKTTPFMSSPIAALCLCLPPLPPSPLRTISFSVFSSLLPPFFFLLSVFAFKRLSLCLMLDCQGHWLPERKVEDLSCRKKERKWGMTLNCTSSDSLAPHGPLHYAFMGQKNICSSSPFLSSLWHFFCNLLLWQVWLEPSALSL